MRRLTDVPKRWDWKKGVRPKNHWCEARTYEHRADICAFGTSCNRLAAYDVPQGWGGRRFCKQHAIQRAGRETVAAADLNIGRGQFHENHLEDCP